MKVFISWSGEQSRLVAEALREWIPDVIQAVEPWLSLNDIDAGVRWNSKISEQLSITNYGILCITKENLNAPWVMFEAGALAKTLKEDTFVCPYLIDLDPIDIPAGPLSQFQAKKADEIGTFDLVYKINKNLKEDALPDDKLKTAFSMWWPSLSKKFTSLPKADSISSVKRTNDDKLNEILEILRGLARQMNNENLPFLGALGLIASRGINQHEKHQIIKSGINPYTSAGDSIKSVTAMRSTGHD